MKPKSDYAFIVGSSNAYSFGLISTMNAQNYFKTNADWEIVHDDLWDPRHRERITEAFPFNVNWYRLDTLISEYKNSFVDKRSNQAYPMLDPWFPVSLLARKLLKEGKYKSVCLLQADQFVFANLDIYFKISESGIFISGEFPFSFAKVQDMPFGNDKGIWDRSMCAAFDSINFSGYQYSEVFFDLVNFQTEDPFKGEATHPMICHNRSICKHVPKDRILGLDRYLWVCDSIWAETLLRIGPTGDTIFNSIGQQLYGWHCRWWQEGRIASELDIHKNSKDVIDKIEYNYNLVKSFMEKFNNMIPEISSDVYEKGFIKRPK